MKKAEFYLYKGRFVSSYFNRTGFCNEIDYFRETKFFELRSHGQIPIRSNVSGIFLDHRTNYEFYFLSKESLDVNNLIMVFGLYDKRATVIGRIKEKKRIAVNLNNIDCNSKSLVDVDTYDRWFILNSNPLRKYLQEPVDFFGDIRFYNNILIKIIINKDYNEI